MLPRDLRSGVELSFGQPPETPPCYLLNADHCPQLRAPYVLLQPEVLVRDPTIGWAPIGGVYDRHFLFCRQDTIGLQLGSDVDACEHASITVLEDRILINGLGPRETIVRVPRDVPARVASGD